MQRTMWRAFLLAMTLLIVGALPAMAQSEDEGWLLANEDDSVLIAIQRDTAVPAGETADGIVVVEGTALVEGKVDGIFGVEADIVINGEGASVERMFTIGGSVVLDEGAMRLTACPSDTDAMEDAGDIWAVRRLRWFGQGFVKAGIDNDRLVISDLRMGQEPIYVFSHVVAVRDNPHWREIPAELLPVSFEDRALAQIWDRIWRDDEHDQAASNNNRGN